MGVSGFQISENKGNRIVRQEMHLDLMRDTATVFPEREHKDEIRSLRIWHCKYKSLQAVAGFQNLEELEIASFPDKSLEILAPLQKLRYLSILHMPKVSDLEALSMLINIESLSLSTSPAWDSAGKCTIVDSLKPVVSMSALKHLELFGVCSADRSLAVLEQCKSLQSARFSQYPKDEVARFYRVTGVANQFNPKPSFHNDKSNGLDLIKKIMETG